MAGDSEDKTGRPDLNINADTLPAEEAQQPAPLPAPSREDLITQAVQFLEVSDVKDASRVNKAAFLESKGLTTKEVDAILPHTEEVQASPPHQPRDLELEQAEIVEAMTRDLPPRIHDRPPIVTFPEYLPPPPPPPPIFNTATLTASAYLFAGVSATIWAATKYYFNPMIDDLTDARLDFANHALEQLDTFNSKLSDLAGRPIPSETHPNPAYPVFHHYGRGYNERDTDNNSQVFDDSDSSVGDPTEVFHVDAQTQTTPRGPRSVVSNIDSDAALPPDEKLDKIQRLLKSLKDEADDVVAADGGELGTNVKELTEYLQTIMYKSSYSSTNSYLPPYVTMGAVGKKDEDDVGKVKAEIRSVKGVLLNIKNFPSGSR